MLENLVSSYIYVLLILGALIQSTSLLIIFGFLANQGKINIFLAILFGTLGSFLGSQIYFFIGRLLGNKIIKKQRSWKKKLSIIENKINKYESVSIIILRFIQGLKSLSSVFFGTTKIRSYKFLFLNLIASFLWASVFIFIGYIFGIAAKTLIGDIGRLQIWILLGIVIIIILYWLWKRLIE